ncbi:MULTISPECIES: hypothetical protein [Myxococcus]|uniref:hypothetical protein n=1 Tax=Myxococcus TaxID=32 RepID=UPI00129C61A1|nr:MULTISPECIES: hypothetical protein [Myxococcus]NOK04173.1 hypothetical protein [Myxococcus xanthus]
MARGAWTSTNSPSPRSTLHYAPGTGLTEAISNPALRSVYDSARLTSLENRALGLNN